MFVHTAGKKCPEVFTDSENVNNLGYSESDNLVLIIRAVFSP